MRRGAAFFFLVISLVMLSCGGRDRLPGGVLSEEKMEAVMYDMMRADQFLGDFVLSQDSTLVRKDESIRLYREILALHDIDQETFRESFYYYRSRPELLRSVMDSINKKDPIAIETNQPRPVLDTTIKEIDPALNPTSEPMKLE
jgi:hypothetical protein